MYSDCHILGKLDLTSGHPDRLLVDFYKSFDREMKFSNFTSNSDEKKNEGKETVTDNVKKNLPALANTSYGMSATGMGVIASDGHFQMLGDGVIRNTKSGLEWYVGPNRDINWENAVAWVDGLQVACGGWQMPTRNQLKGLYQEGVKSGNMVSFFKNMVGMRVWCGQTRGLTMAWYFPFNGNEASSRYKDDTYRKRALAVRSIGTL